MKKILGLIMLSVIVIGLTSCAVFKPGEIIVGKHEQTDEEKVLFAIEETKIPNQTHKGLDLPMEINDVKIEWTCSEELLLDPEQTFYAGEPYEVELIGTFSYKDLEISNTYKVKIEENKNGVFTNAWDYFKKKIPSSTATNFVLYAANKEYNGCTATYKSTNPNVLSDNGKINQGKEEVEVVFLTYLNNGTTTVIYPKTVNILGYTESQKVDLAIEWLEKEMETIGLAEGKKFPDYCEEYDVYINWYSMEMGLITANGSIIRPLTAKDVTFGCTVVCGDANKSLEFNIENYGGNITEVERFKLWCEGIIQTSLRGTKNYVGSDDHLTDQDRTNSYGILNLTVGAPVEIDRSCLVDTTNAKYRYFGSGSLGISTHPDVPQSRLDELFYEGYKMPNEQNILWIVVHETGMPGVGNNAKLLADLQLRNATSGGREASWNYQVDENKIYQSFDDSIICWHASDGTKLIGGGNNNGIGIEMCVNQDGNYDGAMNMNAKLIAHLMHKYNLTLDNVRRHYDFAPDKKQCPYYMIETNRWTEFRELISREYMAQKFYNEGVRFEWKVTDEQGNDALGQYFIHYGQGLYANKPVSKEVVLTVTLTATYNGETYTFSKKLKLKPGSGESNE